MASAVTFYRFIIAAVFLLALAFVIKLPAGHPSAYLLVGTTNTSHTVSSTQCTAELPPDFDLRECYREEFADVPATVQDYETGQPSRFKVEVALFSERPRVGGLTVTTGGASNRLYMLDAMCATWAGPLVVAVWYPVLAPDSKDDPNREADAGTGDRPALATIQQEVRDHFARAEASKTGCQMDIVLITELMDDDMMMATYPINAVRNVGTLLARTDLVVSLDLDFVVSREFSDVALSRDMQRELLLLAKNRTVIVPPAYRIEDEALAQSVALGGRSAGLAALANGSMYVFDGGGGQSPTQYERWLDATEPYEVPFVSGFEPWGVVYRLQAPWFDNRFRGRGVDKVNWFRVLDMTGFRFLVHDELYIVHRPHDYDGVRPPMPLRELWSMNKQWHRSIGDCLRNRTYTTPVTPAFKRCQAQLPWWNKYPPDGEPAMYKARAVPFQRNDTASPAA